MGIERSERGQNKLPNNVAKTKIKHRIEIKVFIFFIFLFFLGVK